MRSLLPKCGLFLRSDRPQNVGHNVLIFAYDKANRLEDRQV
jgi:hypothetical protein